MTTSSVPRPKTVGSRGLSHGINIGWEVVDVPEPIRARDVEGGGGMLPWSSGENISHVLQRALTKNYDHKKPF